MSSQDLPGFREKKKLNSVSPAHFTHCKLLVGTISALLTPAFLTVSPSEVSRAAALVLLLIPKYRAARPSILTWSGLTGALNKERKRWRKYYFPAVIGAMNNFKPPLPYSDTQYELLRQVECQGMQKFHTRKIYSQCMYQPPYFPPLTQML